MGRPDIRFDEEKCTACGLCARDCVSGVIMMKPERPAAVNPQWCNLCSHCLAVCPTEAVFHSGLAAWSTPRPVERERLDAAAYREIVVSRRSVRHFREEEVPRAEIEELLSLAAFSPTASNTCDVGYIVITDQSLIAQIGRRIFAQGRRLRGALERPIGRLFLRAYIFFTGQRNVLRYVERFDLMEEWTASGRDLITHRAPVLIVIHAPARGRFNDANCHIAAANITNYAHARGLGTCYLGLVVLGLGREARLLARLNVPPGRKIYQVLALGYPAYRHAHTVARPLPEIKWL